MQLIKKKTLSRTEVKQTSPNLEVDDKKNNDILNIFRNEHT